MEKGPPFAGRPSRRRLFHERRSSAAGGSLFFHLFLLLLLFFACFRSSPVDENVFVTVLEPPTDLENTFFFLFSSRNKIERVETIFRLRTDFGTGIDGELIALRRCVQTVGTARRFPNLREPEERKKEKTQRNQSEAHLFGSHGPSDGHRFIDSAAVEAKQQRNQSTVKVETERERKM